MSTALIVFAKAPLPGLAKTRLAPALGEAGAAALAARLLDHALAQAVAAGVGPVELCATPDEGHALLRAAAQQHGVALTAQGGGDLGERMQRAFERVLARHGAALLVGSDAPAIDAAMLRRAAAALVANDAVFVPAFDGGYALVGLRRADRRWFDGVAWSTPRVMAETRARLHAAGMRWAELPPVADIDTPADLAQLPPGFLPEGPVPPVAPKPRAP